MNNAPAVVVHGLADARTALAIGLPVTLLSAPGAALFAGCLWWREVVGAARAACPGTPAADILDCADAAGTALSAIREGQHLLVLSRNCTAWELVAARAAEMDAVVLGVRPPALDLAVPGAARHLAGWLAGGVTGRVG